MRRSGVFRRKDKSIVVEQYYNQNNDGFGAYWKLPLASTTEYARFGPAYMHSPEHTPLRFGRFHNGKPINSPNDIVCKSDGSIWFTDPSYGIDSDYEGDASPNEIGAQRVYRIDGASGAVSVVADDFVQPNGLAFSPDESLLYIVDTGATHQADGPHHVRRFKVAADGRTLSGGEVFATCPVGLYDGFRVDVQGNLWLSAGDGVHCHASDGTLLGKILIPEVVANVCFGGAKLNRLFMCGTTSLYSVYLNTAAAPARRPA